MRAVVMAGGEGTRLRPLTTNVPKPLLPVVGEPIMGHILRLLHRHGVAEAVVTVQYLAATIRSSMAVSLPRHEPRFGRRGAARAPTASAARGL